MDSLPLSRPGTPWSFFKSKGLPRLTHEVGLPDGSAVKNPPAMQETPVPFLGWEDPLEKGRLSTPVFLGSLVAQLVKKKNPPAM